MALLTQVRFGCHPLRRAIIALSLAVVPLGAQPDTKREHQIKAAALFNIVSFTEWPDKSFASDEAPLVIGILGQGPISALLPEFAENETWHGRKVVVRRVASVADATICHVVYIGRSEAARWRTMARQFAGRPVLTVSDVDDFVRHGGVVQFTIEHNKVRLTVNLGVARGGGLLISSKVLRLAKIIDTREP